MKPVMPKTLIRKMHRELYAMYKVDEYEERLYKLCYEHNRNYDKELENTLNPKPDPTSPASPTEGE